MPMFRIYIYWSNRPLSLKQNESRDSYHLSFHHYFSQKSLYRTHSQSTRHGYHF